MSASAHRCCSKMKVTRAAAWSPHAVIAPSGSRPHGQTGGVDAGQGVGMVTGVAPVGQVIERLCAGAEKLLAGWG